MSSPGTVQTPQPISADAPAGRRGLVPLGHWRGIPLAAHWTTLLAFVLFAEILATTVLPSGRVGVSAWQYWLAGAVTSAVFLCTLVVHEFAHAVTAQRHGVRVKGITLWLLGGVTELADEPSTPRAEGLVAAAGPVASLALAAVAILLASWVGPATLVGSALGWLGVISAVLAIVNLLPGAPLDGGRIVRAVVWARTGDRSRGAQAAGQAGRAIGFGLITFGLLQALFVSPTGLWLALVGWFMMGSARAESGQAVIARLAGVRAGEVMRPASAPVPDWWTVDRVFPDRDSDAASGDDGIVVLADFGGFTAGAVSRAELERVPEAQRADVRLRDLVGTRRVAAPIVLADASAQMVLAALRAGAGVAVVVDNDGHPVGTITPADLALAAQARDLTAQAGGGDVPTTREHHAG